MALLVNQDVSMKRFVQNLLLAIVFSAVCGVAPFAMSSTAVACPSCKNANETDDLRPRAYMYSILFMLGMPATVFTGFGIAFYRLSKRAALEQQQLDSAESEAAMSADAPPQR
jgi:hypothetical protein